MATPGRRPGVEVEQEFVTAAAALEDPPQPVVIVGIARQIEEDVAGGAYDARTGGANNSGTLLPVPGDDFEDAYPNLILNAVEDLSTVSVKIQNDRGTFDIDDADVNVTPPALPAGNFRVEKDIELEQTLTTGTAGSFAGTASFTDLTKKFINLGVVPAAGDIVAVELNILSGTLIGNTYNITSVTSQTALVTDYAGPALFETGIQYSIVMRFKAYGTLLVSYEAVRSDFNDVLVTILDDDSIEEAVGLIDPRNPAGFAVDKARLNAGEQKVLFTGVSADTVAEHTRALEFMESQPGYHIVPLTQDTAVHQLYDTHVVTTSSPENKRRRVAYLNRELLLRSTKISVADARTGAFNNGTGIFTDSGGGGFDFNDYVVAGDSIIYDDGGTIRELLIQQITGPLTVLINVPGSVNHPGANLPTDSYTALSDTKSKTEQAEFLGEYAQSFAERRVVLVWPDTAEVSHNGVLQLVPGYFLAAGVAGLKSGQRPQQPITNLSVAGFTGLRNSNRYFNEAQLRILSANGLFILEQATESSAPFIRQQRTTDISSILKNELSVVTTVDFVSDVFEQEQQPYIGRYNITPEYLDMLKFVVEGLFRRLRQPSEVGPVILSGRLISIAQDEDDLDTVNEEVEIEVGVPNNFIAVRIQI